MRKHLRKIVPFLTLTIFSSQLTQAQTAPAISYASPQSYTVGTAITPLGPVNTGGAVPAVPYAQTSTINSGFYNVLGIVTDAAHNIYLANGSNNAIYKINPSGIVTVFAGSGNAALVNGTGTAASFNSPEGLAIDAAGNLYVVDVANNDIRKVDPYGVVTTIAGTGATGNANGTGTAASFNNPVGIAIDDNGNLYVADAGNNLIRKITPAGVVSTLAGSGTASYIDGTGTAASFNDPQDVAVDASGNVYVSDLQNEVIRKITPAGVVSTLAGTPGSTGSVNGTGPEASFNSPYGISVDLLGNVYVADFNNNLIRKITSAGVVTTLAGGSPLGDDIGTSAGFQRPLGLYFDPSGNLFTAESYDVRKISLTGYQINSALPAGLAFDPTTGKISGTPLQAASAATYSITGYNSSGSSTATVSITVTGALTGATPPVSPPGITYASPQSYPAGTPIATLAPANTGGSVPIAAYGETTTIATGFSSSAGIVSDAAGNIYYTNLNNILKITPTGVSSVFAGSGNGGYVNGTGTAASFFTPEQLALDASGNLYVADSYNNVIRKITSAGVVSTLAGSGVAGHDDGPAATASFYRPFGVAVDAYGDVYVADAGTNLIRRISPTGIVSTVAGNIYGGYADGTGSSAIFTGPLELALDGSGNLYVADQGNQLIRKVTPAGVVTTLAGTHGTTGAVNGTGTAASFNSPTGLVVDVLGDIYVADTYNQLIRKISPAGVVTTLSGSGSSNAADGLGTAAGFNYPQGITIDASGNLYTTGGDGSIRKVSSVGYSIGSALPAGLTFDPTTGDITGTPLSAIASAPYSVSAYNVGGSSTVSVSIAVTGAITNTAPVAAPAIAYSSPQSYAAGTAITTLSPSNTGGTVPAAAYGQTTTSATGFNISYGIVTDASGNIYFSNADVIEKITPAGVLDVFAGTGIAGATNGGDNQASFNSPRGLAIDAAGNIYVADAGNNLIRKISSAGVVTTVAGSGSAGAVNGPAALANFNLPWGIAIDKFGNIYVSDYYNDIIRKISPSAEVSTLAGKGSGGYMDGSGTTAAFSSPQGIAVDGLGNVYVADGGNQVIRQITPAGLVSTIAGMAGAPGSLNGTGTSATFNGPTAVAVDATGDIYVTDQSNFLIRKISAAGIVTTLAGSGTGSSGDGLGTIAGFVLPTAITLDASGNLWVADDGAVRKVSAVGYAIGSTLPAGLTIDLTTGSISGTPLLATSATAYSISAYNAGGSSTASVNITVTGTITSTPPVPAPSITYATPQSYTAGTSISPLTPVNTGGAVPAVAYGQTTTLTTGFSNSYGNVADASGNIYYSDEGNNVIRKITPAGVSSIFAGSGNPGSANGTGTAASFSNPAGIGIDASGNIYVAELTNNDIRKITPTGVVTTFAGSGIAGRVDGPAATASFNNPSGVAADKFGTIYVADEENNLVRRISASGIVSTLAGSGTAGYVNGTGAAAEFKTPIALAADGSGNVYVADYSNDVIRKVTPAGVVTTLAGIPGVGGSTNGPGASATFVSPTGIAADPAGNVYIADSFNELIRKITAAGVVTTLAGAAGTSGETDGTGTSATFTDPQSLAIDASGNLYVSGGDGELRKVSAVGYSIGSTLPPGLTMDPTTGIITGVPLVATPAANYAVSAYNLGGSSTATVSITVAGTLTAPAPVNAPIISYPTPQSYTSGTAIASLAPTNTGGAVPAATYGQTTTYAGTGVAGSLNGSAATATFNGPANTAADLYGNVYIADYYNSLIRKISSDGIVTTLAGGGGAGYADGTGTAASFSNPTGVAVDVAGNVYVADKGNQVIRKITPAGVVTTLAGSAGNAGYANGTGIGAMFNDPAGVTVDASKNVYVADLANQVIRKITSAGVVTTLAGSAGNAGYANGTGTAALFNYPFDVAVDASGNVYVADQSNNAIRKVTSAGVVTTLAGNPAIAGYADGTGTAATFNTPLGVTVDVSGNIYVADYSNNLVRKITSAGVVTTLAGNGSAGNLNGIGNMATFNQPQGISIDGSCNLYVGDGGNNLIRKIAVTGYTSTQALPPGLSLNGITGVISGAPTYPIAAANYLITAINGGGSGSAMVNITVTGTAVNPATIAAPIISYATPQSYTAGTAISNLIPANTGGAVPAQVYAQTSSITSITIESFGIAVDAAGNVYAADVNNHSIRKILPSGEIITFAGNGTAGSANGQGSAASFSSPQGLVFDAAGNLYVADEATNLIRKITPTGVVTTVAGSGATGAVNGTGTAASFNQPNGLAIDNGGNLYVADRFNDIIRKITSAGVVTTFAGSGNAAYLDGTGTAASFNQPTGIVADAAGNIYVDDTGNDVIRKISPSGVVTTLAGTAGSPGFVNGNGTAASFNSPQGITIDALGNLYVADDFNQVIRMVSPVGAVSTLAGGNSMVVDGAGTAAGFSNPLGISINMSTGNLYSCNNNGAIRKISIVGYSITPALPAGLTFDATTGIISGTPLLASTASNYTVTAYNTGGSSNTVVNIAVTGAITPSVNPVAAPVISYATPQSYAAGTAISPLAPANSGGSVPAAIYSEVSSFSNTNAFGLATDASGNIYYSNGNEIVKATPAGFTSIIAGNAGAGFSNGSGTAATFNNPLGVAIDAFGNIYVIDNANNAIRKISAAGLVTTLAGGNGAGASDGNQTAARFNNPQGVAVDTYGNVYVTDNGNYSIRKISSNGIVSTLAGGNAGYADGAGTAARFSSLYGIVTDGYGNVYVADRGNQLIRKITASGVVSTLAGTAGTTGAMNGTGTSASFNQPEGLAIDQVGNLYVADNNNQLIRKVSPAGLVTTLAGNGLANIVNGQGTHAGFYYPVLVAADPFGNLYEWDSGMRKISIVGYSLAGNIPLGLAFDPTTGIINGTPTLANEAANYSVTAYNTGGNSTTTVNIAVTGAITPPVNPVTAPTIAYASPQSYPAGTPITALPPTNTGGAVPATIYGETSTTVAALASISNGLATDAAGNVYFSVNNQIYKGTPAGVTTLIAGNGTPVFANGTGTAAGFDNIQGLAIDASGNIYVVDYGDNAIRKVTPAGVVTTIAGNNGAGSINGPGSVASFNNPIGVAVDNYGNIYVADEGNNLIRKITPSGEVSTLAGSGNAAYADGTGIAASFYNPWGVAVDGSGNVYVTDLNNFVIRKITPSGVVSTLAGTAGVVGSADGTGASASFNGINGITIDAAGNLYVASSLQTGLIRKVTAAGVVSTIAGGGIGSYTNGIGATSSFYYPRWVATDLFGNLYETDGGLDAQVRKISCTGYHLNSNALPVGLVFDPTTGIISGTPTLAGSAANYTVSAYNLGGSSTATVNIAVTGTITPPINPVAAPVISYSTPQSYAAGTNITALTPANTGGIVPVKTFGETTSFISAAIGGMATDAAGNLYYTTGSQLEKTTPGGVTSIIAGTGSVIEIAGSGTGATFSDPEGVAVDASGNIYVADFVYNSIRKISASGVLTTLAGGNGPGAVNGPGNVAAFNGPQSVAVDAFGNVYVTDVNDYLVRKVSPAGVVSTLAGSGSSGYADGTGTAASFGTLSGIVVDGSGNVYVVDQGNELIRKITPGGVVSTFAGTAGSAGAVNGSGTAASFNQPYGITIDAAGNLYVGDYRNNLIRKISPAGLVSTLAGNGVAGTTNGVGSNSSFYYPSWVATDASGNLFEYDSASNNIRKISLAGYSLALTLPAGLSFDSTTGTISGTPLTAIAAANYPVTAYNTGGSSTATVNITVTGTATAPAAPTVPAFSYATPQTYAVGVPVTSLVPTNTGGAIPATVYGQVSTFAGNGSQGYDNGTGTMASFNNIRDMATDAYGNIYEADATNNVIRKITPSAVVTTFAGSGTAGNANGTGMAASFNNPEGVAIDASNNVYVSDDNNQLIRKITPAGVVTTLAGSGNSGLVNGTGTAASFNDPAGIAVDKSGNVYVVDQQNYDIRKITSAGVVTTLAGNGSSGVLNGTGTAAGFGTITNICIDGSGNLYVYDSYLIRKITAAGVVTTLAGSGSAGYDDGTGTAASFNNYAGELKTDAGGNIYLADDNNYLIRKITPAGVATTIAGDGGQNFINGTGTGAGFYYANALAADNFGNLYISDGNSSTNTINVVIREMYIGGYTINTPFPLGLEFSNTTGIISGTPTAASAAANYTVYGNNSAGTTPANINITVIYPPLVTTTTTATTFTSMGDVTPVPVVIDGGVTVTDPSKTTLASATVSITGNFVSTEDVLGFTANPATMGNIAGTYNSTTGILSLTSSGSTATVAQFQTALEAVTYNDTNDAKPNVSSRTVSFTASDGSFSAITPATKTINLTYTPSHNATLSNLAISPGTLTPAFSATTTSYTSTVSNSVSSITVIPTAASLYAKITVNGVAVTSGTASASIPLTVGANTITTVVTAEDLSTEVTYTITVTRDASQVITFNPIAAVTYGVAPFAPGATSTSAAAPITYLSSNTAVATIVSGEITVVGAGSSVITASQAASTGYDAAAPVSQTLTVNQAALTITANNGSKTYGAANPTLTATFSGFVNSDTQTSLSTQPTIATTATTSSAAGSYPITAIGASGANYAITYVAGTLTVGQAALTITATNQSKTYGAANPALTATYSGFVNGDTQTSLTTQPAISTTATTSSATGTYPISASGAVDANYAISYVAGTLTVGQAALTITANNQSKAPSTANPTLTVTYTGFVNGDTQAGLTTQPTVSTTATTSSPVGSYPITANGAADANYAINYVAGILTVTSSLTPPNISYASPPTYTTGTAIASLAPANTGGAVPATIYSQVSTFAGSGTAGAVNGTGTAASFSHPYGTATDASGNVYVADYSNNLIREISPAGVVTTFAGSGTAGAVNGTGTAASFNGPRGVATDASGNIYVADYSNNRIRKISPAGVVTTLAGSGSAGAANGTGTAATFNGPVGVATDASGNVYVADQSNNLVREISPAGVVTTFAGSGTAGAVNGTGTAASFHTPVGVAVDAGSNVYVADLANNLIRKISPAGVVTTLAGSGTAGAVNGTGTAASFNTPHGVAIDASGNVYVADFGNNLIRLVSPAGVVTTLAGTGTAGAVNATGTGASFNLPIGIAADASGNVYVADYTNSLIRKIVITGYVINPALPAGLSFNGTTGTISGTPTAASPATAYTVSAYNAAGSGAATVNVTVVNALNPPNISYASPQTYTTGTAIASLAPANTGGAVPATIYSQVSTLAGSGTAGAVNGTGTAASFSHPYGTATDASGNVYVADYSNNLIREISPAGAVTTFAGSGTAGAVNGTGTAASFNGPRGVATDASGNVYVADYGNNRIRKISPAGVVTTLAGSGSAGAANGTGTAATFNGPVGVATDASGNVYVADQSNNLVREISPAGVVTTFAGSGTAGAVNGTGTAASFHTPVGVATDASANVYVADLANDLIRKISPAGVVTTLAGSGVAGSANGTGTAATFNAPHGVAIDASGNIYVADGSNNLIREISPAGVVTTLAGITTPGSANGIGTAATFNVPLGIATDAFGNLYVADYTNSLIRKIVITGFIINAALPAGLSFDGTTGAVSGTPTATSPATAYTVTAYNAAGSGTANVSISVVVAPSPPAISYTSPQTYTTGTAITALTPTNTGGAVPATVYSQVSTFAGSGTAGAVNGTGTAASFSHPYGTATDASGNVYVADYSNNLIREISPAGVVTTFAGSGTAGAVNGTGTAASFNGPRGVATDASGNIYVADYSNNRIRKISPAGVVTTLAGSGSAGAANGTGTAATFNGPVGVATDASGNVYVADQSNNLVREISPAGVVTTFAGSGTAGAVNGTGTAASFHTPVGVAVDAGSNVYVADLANNLIRKISPAGVVTTLAGSGTAGAVNGTGTAASFNTPHGVAIDASGNVYVADFGNNLIRLVSPAGVVTTLAGTGTAGAVNATGTGASFNLPIGIAADASGNVYVADYTNSLIRKIVITGYAITPALSAGLGFNGTNGTISGTPTTTSSATTYKVTAYNTLGSSAATVNITVVNALNPPNISYASPQTYTTGTAIASLAPANTGGAVPATIYSQVSTLAGSGTAGAVNGTGTAASFSHPYGTATDASGNVYVADYSNNLIREISPAGAVTTFAGSGTAGAVNGTGTAASFNGPRGVATDASGNVYVADYGNNRIRKISPAGVVTTLAGSGSAGAANGTGTAATFNGPVGVATDASGNVYVADQSNNLVREISPAGVVTTFAGSGTAGAVNGTGTAASFHTPVGVAVDAGSNVYVADLANNLIRKISPAGVVTTLAGSGTAGAVNGTGTAATFNAPHGVAIDASGNIYVADGSNNLIREISPAGVVTTLAGITTPGSANGIGTAATFNVPLGIATDAFGNLYVADYTNSLIRKIVITGFIINAALPAGLSFDGTTGTVSGTPTATSPATAYTVTAYNAAGSSTTTVNITVNSAPAPKVYYMGPQKYTVNTIITPLIPSVTGGVIPAASFAQDTTLVKDGADSAHAVIGSGVQFSRFNVNGTAYLSRKTMITGYTITPDLPAGLSLDVSTGKISGTPIANMPATDFIITALNPLGNSVAHLVITVGSLDINGNTVKTGVGPYLAAVDTTALAPVVHQALSPNGDGKDDFLMIENITTYPDNKITLVDRNGALVYRTEGYDNTNKLFDGHSNITGAMQKQGTYFYILEYVDVTGKTKRQTGFFVLKY